MLRSFTVCNHFSAAVIITNVCPGLESKCLNQIERPRINCAVHLWCIFDVKILTHLIYSESSFKNMFSISDSSPCSVGRTLTSRENTTLTLCEVAELFYTMFVLICSYICLFCDNYFLFIYFKLSLS